ncbi:hypothetical protein D5086_032895 [Populus alba]|uniref:Uncharacterized protein n=2 Tax=Populus TaxID=3689 RepID=A0ACC4AFA8_POPAL|nr:hypothetical protein NC653_040802 [Populus alba x Populus x berolinensis]
MNNAEHKEARLQKKQLEHTRKWIKRPYKSNQQAEFSKPNDEKAAAIITCNSYPNRPAERLEDEGIPMNAPDGAPLEQNRDSRNICKRQQ